MTDRTDSSTDSSTDSAPAPTVWACLNYRDAPAAIAFLTDVVGFRLALSVPAEDDRIAHAELRWPEGGGVMLGSAGRADSEFSEQTTGAASVYVVTADPRGVHDRVTAAGVDVVRPMETTDYGSEQFAFADAEGNLWCFGTYAGEA